MNDDDDDEASGSDALSPWLADIRNSASRRRRATNAGILAGLVLAAVHPLGLVLGGALTALPQERFRTGILAGLGFGLLVVVVFAAQLAVTGALATALETGEILGVTVGAALVLPAIGSLARGLA